jgi:hypothetical protein
VDYVLQLASVGYSAAYIHTREAGISYNLVVPPLDTTQPWGTNPTFYSLLATAEILQSDKGAKIVDLNIGGSKTDAKSDFAGYAVYDGASSSVTRVALFNFGTASSQFTIPSSVVPKNAKVQVKYLSSSSLTEKTNIAWAGQTYVGAGDGKAVAAPKDAAWARPNVDLDCSKECKVDVQGPTLAVVFFSSAGSTPSGNGSNSNNNGSGSSGGNNRSPGSGAMGLSGPQWFWSLSSLFLLTWAL